MDQLEEGTVHQVCHRGQKTTGPKHQRNFNWQKTFLAPCWVLLSSVPHFLTHSCCLVAQGSRKGSEIGEPNSEEPGREPRVNFNEQPNRRRTYGSTRRRDSSSSMPQGTKDHGAQTSEEVQLAKDFLGSLLGSLEFGSPFFDPLRLPSSPRQQEGVGKWGTELGRTQQGAKS